MKVILLRDIAKIGKRGDVREVADGYAVNVLIPKKDAVQATPAELSKLQQAEDKKRREKDKSLQVFHDLSILLEERVPVIEVTKHDNGHLFAAITQSQVVDAIFEAVKLSLDPKQIDVGSIKKLGEHTIAITSGSNVLKAKILVKAK